PDATPIDPVRVDGMAKIRSASVAIQYPPDPAMAPMDTTTGFPFSCARATARRMLSDAGGDPPGLSIRRTIAFIFLSLIARSNVDTRRSAAATPLLHPDAVLSDTIFPVAYIMPTWGRLSLFFGTRP